MTMAADPFGDMLTDEEPSSSENSPKSLTDSQIKAIISREIHDAIGSSGSQVAEQQRQAIRFYEGKPLGNEIPGRSQVVSMDVLETIEWVMPSAMRVFTGGSKIWEYMPRAQRDEQSSQQAEKNAKDATSFINWFFMSDMDGFSLLYDWIKTAFMEKNGIAKVVWEEKRRPEVLTFTGMLEEHVAELLSDENVDLLSNDERIETIDGQTIKLYDVSIRRWNVEKKPRCEAIPPEEFGIAKRCTKLNDDTPFCFHRRKVTVSDLVAMGFPFEKVSQLHSDDSPEYSIGRTERHSDDDWTLGATTDRHDAASRELWVSDCFIRIDEDGDGYAELRNILVVGDDAATILDDREVSMNPFISICPVPMPHRFYGNSLADLVLDIQVLRTTILRQIMDHLYLAVNPRLGVVEGQVEYGDLMTVRPGGLVRARSKDSIFPIELPQLPPAAFDLYQGLEEIRGNRTGVVAHGTEIDASAINSTATGLAQLMAEKAQKVELFCRIIANGIKQLGSKLARIVIENDTKKAQYYINGGWLEINPSQWDIDMLCEVQVGLGAGQALERIGNLEKIAAAQAQVVASGNGDMVTRQNIYQTACELVEACGFRNPYKFFSSPDGKEPPPPPPNPDMEKLKLESLKIETEQAIKKMELEFNALKERHLDEFRFRDLESKERVERERIAMEERVRLGQQEATLEAARITAAAKSAEPEGDSDE